MAQNVPFTYTKYQVSKIKSLSLLITFGLPVLLQVNDMLVVM